ncbi:MAG: stage II sporulation protein D [Oscillospiraceae bacterium]|nr:stage II sporulation protein D [Oscillospiraceae bacterium]
MLHRVAFTSVLLTLFLLLLPLTAPLPASVLLERSVLPPTEAEPAPVEEEAPVPEEGPPEEALSAAGQAASPEADTAAGLLPGEITLLRPDGTPETMTLEDYLWGVVAAEMPASFHPEALKAQAVAARSYTACRLLEGSDRHPEANVCADFGCCQAWMSREERMERWGEEGEGYAGKISDAIAATAGEYLVWESLPALAVFHASSDGATRSAQSVWGQQLPYLVSVSSPEGEQDAPNYYSTVSYPAEEFAALFLSLWPEADLSGDCGGWFSAPEREEGGGLSSLQVGGVRVTAQELRTLCALRSASFEVSCQDGTVTFQVTGYGHGVGMSQYGANVLAKQGSDYRQILAHYYPGTEICG